MIQPGVNATQWIRYLSFSAKRVESLSARNDRTQRAEIRTEIRMAVPLHWADTMCRLLTMLMCFQLVQKERKIEKQFIKIIALNHHLSGQLDAGDALV